MKLLTKSGPSLKRDLLLCIAIVVICAFIKFGSGCAMLGLTAPDLITSLFNIEHEGFTPYLLLTVFAYKWVESAIAISLPVPTGCVAPVLVLGALLGRSAGMLLPVPYSSK